MLGTTEEVQTNTLVMFSYGTPYIDTPVLADQQQFTFISPVWTLDAIKKTY